MRSVSLGHLVDEGDDDSCEEDDDHYVQSAFDADVSSIHFACLFVRLLDLPANFVALSG